MIRTRSSEAARPSNRLRDRIERRARSSTLLIGTVAIGAALLAVSAIALPLTGATRVATGGEHTCSLTTGGGVKCWGSNANGQLGNGTTVPGSRAADVTGLGSNATAITAGEKHTCALTSSGGVKCWGANSFGQLGNGTTTDSSLPTDVAGLPSGVIAIDAGSSHTCAVLGSGGVKCWGNNNFGQLGNGTTTPSSTPTDATGLASGVTSISAGRDHTCAVAGGSAKCWGSNGSGQLGVVIPIPPPVVLFFPVPTDVIGLASGVTAIAAGGFHSCAVVNGGAKCWGANTSGQVGNGNTGFELSPVDVVGLASGVTGIAAGYLHSCAVVSGGGVKCWGFNASGQLGNGTIDNALTPADVTGLTAGGVEVAAGNHHTCALTSGGSVKCWGLNTSGQLGNGTIASSSELIPTFVVGLTSAAVVMTSTGARHTCALTSNGGVKCWGWGSAGQLGNGTITDRFVPTDVVGLASGVSAIAPGGIHSCALTGAGGVKCWGDNSAGQLGNGTTDPALTPVDSGLVSNVTAVSSGEAHVCALTTAGGVKCWGQNGLGQLGNGTTDNALTPNDVTGLTSGVVAIAAGGYHTCALVSGGGMKCWGHNSSGQLGDGTLSQSLVPKDVTGLTSGVIAMAPGEAHSCALVAGGGIKCWGNNGYGQLGNGTTVDELTPISVTGITSVTGVETGALHTCAVTSGGGLKCWGLNENGQLGNGTTTSVSIPTDVTGLASGVANVTASWEYTCAGLSGGGIKCWGDNQFGQLGVGAPFVPIPGDVLIAACADFVDVAPTSAFCRNVEWLRNRAVTLGCALLDSYCPNDLVNRLAMAAFMNRLGTALTGKVLWQEASQGAVDLDAGSVVCQTVVEPGVNHTRRAHVAGVFSGSAASTTGFGAALVASIDNGVTWLSLRPRTVRAAAPANRWANTRDSGQFDLEAGDAVRFGIRVSRDGLPGGADLTAGRCMLRALIGNRQSPVSPFDLQ